jgi:hypothetical protein
MVASKVTVAVEAPTATVPPVVEVAPVPRLTFTLVVPLL